MKTTYGIKNFRVFDENGVEFQLEPITILTGCNSSGKSSIVKSVLLLDSYLKQIKDAYIKGKPIDLKDYILDFGTFPLNSLGRFDKVLHRGSEISTITFEYIIYSLILSKDVNISMTFQADDKYQQNAYLIQCNISMNDVVILSFDQNGNGTCNCNNLMDAFLDFFQLEVVYHRAFEARSAYELDGQFSREEYESCISKLRGVSLRYDSNRKGDIYEYLLTSYHSKSIDDRCGSIDDEVYEWSRNHKSLFMIPLLEHLSTMSKEKVWSYVMDTICVSQNEKLVAAAQRILNDFISSKYDSIKEYALDWEKQHLEHASIGNVFQNISDEYRAFSTNAMIHQNYLFELTMANPSESWTLENEGMKKYTPSLEELEKRKAQEDVIKSKPLTYEIFYEVIMDLNKIFVEEANNIYLWKELFLPPYGEYRHIMASAFLLFTRRLVAEVLTPNWVGTMDYASSQRISIKRLYSFDEKEEFTNLLKAYSRISTFPTKSEFGKPEILPGTFINRWIKKLELGTGIKFELDSEGLGLKLYLEHKNEDPTPLTDEGYGITQLVYILLQIEKMILTARGQHVNRYLGFADFSERGKKYADFIYEQQTMAIEEPEIHLHPKFQSILAEMFVEAYKKYNIHFIVETHSEYLIRKLQTLVAGVNPDMIIKPSDVSILYVGDSNIANREVGEPQVKQIGIREDGYLDDTFGTGFFDEATKRLRELK